MLATLASFYPCHAVFFCSVNGVFVVIHHDWAACAARFNCTVGGNHTKESWMEGLVNRLLVGIHRVVAKKKKEYDGKK